MISKQNGLAVGNRLCDFLAESAVLLHHFELFRGELSRLEQDSVSNANLPDVMQLGRRLNNIQFSL